MNGHHGKGGGPRYPLRPRWVSIGARDTRGTDLGRATVAANNGLAIGSALGNVLFNLPNPPSASFALAAVAVLGGFAMRLGLPSQLLARTQWNTYRAA